MSADELEALARAFQESRILLTAVELDLFSAVSGGATAGEAAMRLKTDLRATELLLNALTALGLLVKNGEVFDTEPVVAPLLVQGSPDCVRPALLHWVHRWESWSRLTERVRGAAPAEEYRELDRSRHEACLAMLDRRSSERAAHLVAAVGAEGVRRLLDVGGGSGAYSIAFARANPELRAEVFELPEVVPITQRYIERAGLAGRIEVRPGDFLSDQLGSGYDLILLCSVAHLVGDEELQDLFRRSYQALAPGGRLAIHDHILDTARTSPRASAVFALNMLVATPRGRTYSFEEFSAWLSEAGFRSVERRPFPGPTGVLVAAR